jgi:chromosome segregation protein
MLTRRYYRSGESEYYLNRQSVRLKDIMELLLDTGLGRDGYSVIGQGRIAEIVSAKSTDRREIFEEAAGISRYRYRKEESERKLQRTEENLLRVKDKIDELELQVGPLQEQAETAKKYLLLRDELRVLEISLWMETLDRLHDQSHAVQSDFEDAQRELGAQREMLDGLYARSENLAAEMRELDVEAEGIRALVSAAEAGCADSESAAAVLRANIRNNSDSMERLRREQTEQEGRARGLEDQIGERQARIGAIAEELFELKQRILELERQSGENTAGMDEAQRALGRLLAQESEKKAALAENRTALSMLSDAVQELYDRDTESAAELGRGKEKHAANAVKLSEDEDRLAKASERENELQNAIAGRRLLLRTRETKAEELRERRLRLSGDLRAVDDRIALLTELEKDYEGFNKAVKTVMREAEHGLLKGVRGPVAKLLQTDDRYAQAIETALGGALQHIVVDTQEQGKASIELLKKRDAGRCTFLPVDSIKGGGLRRVPADEPGFVGVAAELVRFDDRYAQIVANLLGRTVVAETLGDAVRMAKRYDNAFRIVSLDGQVINAGGSMTGGSAGRGTGILSRANELRGLGTRRTELAEKSESAGRQLSEAARELEAVRYELEVAQGELSEAQEERRRRESEAEQSRLLLQALDESLQGLASERAGIAARLAENNERIERTRAHSAALERELEALSAERARLSRGREDFEEESRRLNEERSEKRALAASLEAESAAAQLAAAQLTELLKGLEGDGDERRSALEELEQSSAALQEELRGREARLTELRERAQDLKQQLSGTAARRLELEGKRTSADRAAQDKNRELLERERTVAQLEQKMMAARMEEKQIIDRLWDSYELSRSAAQAVRRPLESVPQAGRPLGTPNLGAIEEYQRVSARYEFLTEQRDDVETAKAELLKIIGDITKEMEEIFLREFRSIDTHFRETFLELFGGGRATLQLEDESAPLACGIEIRIQPPGKALSSISLLSGGEKAFVAIALYFAMMKVRPTPFCVMDEIESALDEANVIRFSEYMRSMSAKTQFIAITHRRGTMEQADMLYGVTMQEKGVSSVLSMDMAEAARVIKTK